MSQQRRRGKSILQWVVMSTLSCLILLGVSHGAEPNPPLSQSDTRDVDVVIVLDVSGSMDDLLDSVRARIWDVVSELGRMQPAPKLRVGLITYGSAAAAEEAGYVQLRQGLTTDLDQVYAELFSIKPGGSFEYVGRALEVALDQSKWSTQWDALRLVFVAGNETLDQDLKKTDWRWVARDAQADGIWVNSIFAGSRKEALSLEWPELAQRGGGTFSSIDPASFRAQIETPQDAKLLELNRLLNQTYLPYGTQGEAGLTNQTAQDNNASRLGVESCSSRIAAKGTAVYTNASWDLVDATADPDFNWRHVARDELPEALRALDENAANAHIEKLRDQRASVQQEIQLLAAAREAWLLENLEAEERKSDLATAMRRSVRAQARARGFECEGC